jgi:dethiobiotin synthetase
MGNGLFITGTDTGVGKTFFTCALAALLKSYGYKVGVMKPAETGCVEKDGTLVPVDAGRLKDASGCAEPIEMICPYRLPEPLAPSIAAERAGVKIDVDHLLAVYREISAKQDITLVEGAGGLMVPLVPSFTFADFARVAKLPLIVVAANKLGMINHLLLDARARELQGTAHGWLCSESRHGRTVACRANQSRGDCRHDRGSCLGEMPFVSQGDGQELLEREFDLRLIDWVLQ